MVYSTIVYGIEVTLSVIWYSVLYVLQLAVLIFHNNSVMTHWLCNSSSVQMCEYDYTCSTCIKPSR